MKILLVALNSKYIHSCLAVWSLKVCCRDMDAKVLEFTINDSYDRVLSCIYRGNPDVVAFSCYIWNITRVLQLVSDIKKVLPGTAIVLGGPEVSFDSQKTMEENGGIDYIVLGEGEPVFADLIKAICGGDGFDKIKGLVWRSKTGIHENSGYNIAADLNSIPFAYSRELLDSVHNRIAYYESSRGCPYSCSYCLSSVSRGVRYLPLNRVKKELALLVDAGVKQVKFIDRTFNCNRERAYSILEYIIDRFGEKEVNFHFEAGGDLFDRRTLELLAKARPGLIQFEVGVQSTNKETLEQVERKTDLDLLAKNIKGLRSSGNIHIHLDLIAGLPGETAKSFAKSFNDVYCLRPHMLQLGFLKLLKGSGLRKDYLKNGYGFCSQPPYEVLYSDSLSFADITVLKDIEVMLNRYYNSGRFMITLEYMVGLYGDPFDFYRIFSQYNAEKGFLHSNPDVRRMYTILLEFAEKTFGKDGAEVIAELLRFDYLCCYRPGRFPDGFRKKSHPLLREKCLQFLRDEENLRNCFPHYVGLSMKNIIKWIGFEDFEYDMEYIIKRTRSMSTGDAFRDIPKKRTVILFDYGRVDPVTGRYQFYIIKNNL